MMNFKDILDSLDAETAARMKKKVPQWAGIDGIEFPTRLSTEQCSSSATALYKAALISSIFTCRESSGGCGAAEAFPQRSEDGTFPLRHGTPSAEKRPVVIDLTGGLGVDCWAFCDIASHVHHNEMNAELSEAVKRNFNLMGISNISFSCIEVIPGRVQEVAETSGHRTDIIFLDPARRSGTGKKVFLMEDCSPDIMALKDELIEAAPDILIKLSPMADITMVCKRLGSTVREVHVVESEGECKELLVWMQRGWNDGYEVVFKDMRFSPEEEAEALPSLLENTDALAQAGTLFEPSAAMLKSGCFSLACGRLGLKKLGRFTHIYTSDSPDSSLKAYGKLFSIKKVLQFNGRTVKALGKEFPRCEVTSRNLPLTSDELKKKMGVTSGGDVHIFACTANFETGTERIIIAASRI